MITTGIGTDPDSGRNIEAIVKLTNKIFMKDSEFAIFPWEVNGKGCFTMDALLRWRHRAGHPAPSGL